ncbi:regulator of microtubule dynamics protein 1 [Trypanosoma conorhini]|uniref:Regulator of microtubule dynamics protein 1 n=1 Tax=Trypanosoma conorhini TaxID=83891 RepID=A0A3R7P0D1_9TRYP|nr:regulator of microtubule dynamics protein 1 [Trypanosoma conorhini]RNF26775.1 regulator of microtubule dynamics protein 1 [Trypanosoma conorhini]
MSSWEQVAQEADQATDAKNITAAHELLKKAIEGGLHHPQIAWRYARSLHEMAEETTDKTARKVYFKEGLEWAKKAVEEDPSIAAAHKWFSVLLSAQNEFISSKEKWRMPTPSVTTFSRPWNSTRMTPPHTIAWECGVGTSSRLAGWSVRQQLCSLGHRLPLPLKSV